MSILSTISSGLLALSILLPPTPMGSRTASILPEPIPDIQDSGPTWRIELDFPTAYYSGEEVNALLQSRLSTYETVWQVEAVSEGAILRAVIESSGSLDQLRGIIFYDLASEINFLGGTTQIVISGDIQAGTDLNILFESNPSTGYLWQVNGLDAQLIQQMGKSELVMRSGQIGSPQTQIMNFSGIQNGYATLVFNYRRPWEADASPSRRIYIENIGLAGSVDLTDPISALATFAAPSAYGPAIGETSSAPLEASPNLPAAFDWRDQVTLPAVRNQGTCGSCWAFATVGTMEVAMVVQGEPIVDLSEQYLISCNQSGWSCNGGWRAHDYHSWKVGKNQNQAGAVLETDFPYSGTNGTCTTAYNHPYKISDWAYVRGLTVPPADEIKQAIYTYGAVTASICMGPELLAYRGGVFSTDESSVCGSYISNHAIVLVGWNDAEDTWIMRNSWGSWWGEGGYIRIKRDVSNIGYAPTYVVYKNPIPSPVTPSGSTTQATPTFKWGSVDDGVSYKLQVSDSNDQRLLLSWYDANQICSPSDGTCQIAPLQLLDYGQYKWFIKTKNSAGLESDWSREMNFTILPAAPQTQSPSGDIPQKNPAFTWNIAPNAAEYRIKVSQSAQTILDSNWSAAATVCTAAACKLEPSLNLSVGDYSWTVQARTSNGVESSWSDTSNFTVVLLAPVPTVPTGTINTQPVFTWDNLPLVSQYKVQINNDATGDRVYLAWHAAADVCGSSAATCQLTLVNPLPAGSYRWTIKYQDNDQMDSPWSDWQYFNIEFNLPASPELIAPTGNLNTMQPVFTWKPTANSDDYQLKVDGPSGTVIQESYAAINICSTSTCTAVPGVDLPAGSYNWVVQGSNAHGTGFWSAALNIVSPASIQIQVANPIPDQGLTFGSQFDFTLPQDTFQAPAGVTLYFSATLSNGSPLPSWITTYPDNTTSGRFTGLPAASDVGSYVVKVTASDGNGAIVSDEFSLTINKVDTITKITSISPQPSGLGQPIEISIEVDTNGGPAPSGSVVVGSSSASCTVVLNSNSGKCSLTLPQAGAHDIIAHYQGSQSHNSSVSGLLQQTVENCFSLDISAPNGNVTFSPQPNCGGTLYLPGTTVQVAANPDNNFIFTGWDNNTNQTGSPKVITVNASQQVVAGFTRKGDVNGDGSMDIIDSLFMLQVITGLRDSSQLILPVFDVNGNGINDSIDALFVQQCVVGMANSLCPSP
jgi:predicted secreted protein